MARKGGLVPPFLFREIHPRRGTHGPGLGPAVPRSDAEGSRTAPKHEASAKVKRRVGPGPEAVHGQLLRLGPRRLRRHQVDEGARNDVTCAFQ